MELEFKLSLGFLDSVALCDRPFMFFAPPLKNCFLDSRLRNLYTYALFSTLYIPPIFAQFNLFDQSY